MPLFTGDGGPREHVNAEKIRCTERYGLLISTASTIGRRSISPGRTKSAFLDPRGRLSSAEERIQPARRCAICALMEVYKLALKASALSESIPESSTCAFGALAEPKAGKHVERWFGTVRLR
jgi:hypothetical protein